MGLQDFYACVVDSETAEATEGIEAGWKIVYVSVDGSSLWFYSSEAEGVSLIKRIAIWGFHYNQFIIIVLQLDFKMKIFDFNQNPPGGPCW